MIFNLSGGGTKSTGLTESEVSKVNSSIFKFKTGCKQADCISFYLKGSNVASFICGARRGNTLNAYLVPSDMSNTMAVYMSFDDVNEEITLDVKQSAHIFSGYTAYIIHK